MVDLVLNSFPVELTPRRVCLPYVECGGWKSSAELRRSKFANFRTYRYERGSQSEGTGDEKRVIRLILLSGPDTKGSLASDEFDVGELPGLGSNLIEQAVSQFLESQGLSIKRNRFERLALRRVESSPGQLIQLYAGISFRARRPFSEHPYAFTLSAQWVARATFRETLSNQILSEISPGLGVLYTPKGQAISDLHEFENHYLGRVKEIAKGKHAVVGCRDSTLRSIAVGDLTLEASPEAIRRYEQRTGSSHQPMRVWRRLQQLSQVLMAEGRRNTGVLRNRLDAIRRLLGGASKEQLILPLDCYQGGTITVGLAALRVEITA